MKFANATQLHSKFGVKGYLQRYLQPKTNALRRGVPLDFIRRGNHSKDATDEPDAGPRQVGWRGCAGDFVLRAAGHRAGG